MTFSYLLGNWLIDAYTTFSSFDIYTFSTINMSVYHINYHWLPLWEIGLIHKIFQFVVCTTFFLLRSTNIKGKMYFITYSIICCTHIFLCWTSTVFTIEVFITFTESTITDAMITACNKLYKLYLSLSTWTGVELIPFWYLSWFF